MLGRCGWSLALLLLAPSLRAGGPWQDLQEGRRHFDAGRLSRAAGAFSVCAAGLSGCAKGEAQAWLFLSYVRELEGRQKEARACLPPALRAAERAAREPDNAARSWSLLADVHGRFVLLGGFLDALRHGPANASALERARALAPEDPVVLAAQGRRFLYAPAVAGGNAAKAVDCLERSQAGEASDVTLYFLGLAQRKMGMEDRARAAFEASLALDPDNLLSKQALNIR